MELTLESRTPCLLCGYQLRTLRFMAGKINRRSVVCRGPALVVSDRGCPECGNPVVATVTETYRLHPDSKAAVAAYRAGKWAT